VVEKLAQKKLDTFSDSTILLSATSPSPKQFKGDPQNLVVEENNVKLEDPDMKKSAQETLMAKVTQKKYLSEEKAAFKKKKKRGTQTSSFGVTKRENHDSTAFYSQKIYSGLRVMKREVEYIENEIPNDVIDKVHCLDSRDMSILPDSSIHLMVTSPPYVAAKEYDKEWTLDEYRKLLRDVFTETYKKLVPGGRACVNIANLGRTPYIPLHAYVIQDMLDIGYLMRGEIIWDKGASAGTSCAWGSWRSAKSPTLRDVHEYIMIFSKETFKRENNGKADAISKDEFLEFTKSIWHFPTESAKRVGHPAPFPVELPYRLIQLYTFRGDVVLDPFVGSGSTCVAAIKAERHFVGFDIEKKYIEVANKRIEKFLKQRHLTDYSYKSSSFQ